jgi:DNA repair ATPase RecN
MAGLIQREMEASLVPELHLIEQLEKEIERERTLMQKEEEQLNELTKNAAREESLRKQQMKKVIPSSSLLMQIHPLLKQMSSSKETKTDLNLKSQSLVPAYDVTQDEDMMGILKSLGSHLTTMNSNLKDMKEVRAWINRTEESLCEVLRRLGDPTELDRVYGAELL